MSETEEKKDKQLNKPMRGDVKKYKVYVKDPSTGNVKKVNFGDPNMKIKRDNPERRKAFRARHKCDTAKDKTTPRYWSCKFWGKNPVSKILNELIEPDNIEVDVLLKKDHLCSKIWGEDEKLHPEVREALLKNAQAFIKFAGLENESFKDIILTGSLANYNWHEGSDLDVHILMDLNQISDDKEFANEFFRTKKLLWGEKMPVKVNGHDVELYVQDINEPHASTGVYSIWNNDWVTKPIKEMIAIDTNNIQQKASYIMGLIDDLEDTVDDAEVAKVSDLVMDKLRNYRKAGLEDEGEFSTENLVFKILRNTGYLEKLSKMKYDRLQKELTLEGILGEASLKDKLVSILRNSTIAFGLAVAGLALGTLSSDELIQSGVNQNIVIKATNYIQNLDQKEFERVVQKAKNFPKYLDQKIKELDNEEKILN